MSNAFEQTPAIDSVWRHAEGLDVVVAEIVDLWTGPDQWTTGVTYHHAGRMRRSTRPLSSFLARYTLQAEPPQVLKRASSPRL